MVDWFKRNVKTTTLSGDSRSRRTIFPRRFNGDIGVYVCAIEIESIIGARAFGPSTIYDLNYVEQPSCYVTMTF